MLLQAHAIELGVSPDIANVELGAIEALCGKVSVADAQLQLDAFIKVAPTGHANVHQFLTAFNLPVHESTVELFEMIDTDEDGACTLFLSPALVCVRLFSSALLSFLVLCFVRSLILVIVPSEEMNTD